MPHNKALPKPINASLWMVFLIISCLSTLQKDTLIQDRTSAIKEGALDKYNQIVSQFPSEKQC